jgi:hypothetical protein
MPDPKLVVYAPAKPMSRTDILTAATEAVKRRNLNYGNPEDNFARIAVLWNAWLSIRKEPVSPLTAVDVAIMLGDVKKARLANDSTHEDSWVDLAGYAACGAECAD